MSILSSSDSDAEDNLLELSLGPIPEDTDLFAGLLAEPPLPKAGVPIHQRPYEAMQVVDLHIPRTEELDIARTIDMLLRESYRMRPPGSAQTARGLYQKNNADNIMRPHPIAAFIGGISGVGKSTCIERSLLRYRQFITHDHMPGYVGSHEQIVWLHVNVPGSGLLREFGAELIRVTAEAYGDDDLRKSLMRGNEYERFSRCIQFLKARFLGVLVIDEAQNLFKPPPLNTRQRPRRVGDRELRVADTRMLRELLIFINTSRIAVVFAATPDGMALLQRNCAINQRLGFGGYHELTPAKSSNDKHFREVFCKKLFQYQWSDVALDDSSGLPELLYESTAGVYRIMAHLWIHAHRVAADRQSPSLLLSHFEIARDQKLGKLKQAVDALKSGAPDALLKFEDLLSQV